MARLKSEESQRMKRKKKEAVTNKFQTLFKRQSGIKPMKRNKRSQSNKKCASKSGGKKITKAKRRRYFFDDSD